VTPLRALLMVFDGVLASTPIMFVGELLQRKGVVVGFQGMCWISGCDFHDFHPHQCGRVEANTM
jgi:hypothetical protein